MHPNSHLAPRTSPPTVGDAAPDFELPDQNRQSWTLSEALKKGDVALCFFPFAFTSVCATEMKCVDAEMAQWQGKGATVVGVSCDSPAALKAWADQLGLKQTLLSDLHRAVCKAYGLYWADLNVAQRGTVVVRRGADGRPIVRWVQSRPPGQAMDWSQVLAALA